MEFAFQWLRCESSATCSTISEATSARYTLLAADVGKALRVAVIAANKNGSTAATSDPTSAVSPPPSTPPPPPPTETTTTTPTETTTTTPTETTTTTPTETTTTTPTETTTTTAPSPYFVGDFDTCDLSQWNDFHDAQMNVSPPGFVVQSTPRFGSSGCAARVNVTNAPDTSSTGDASALWERLNSYQLPWTQNGADTWFRMQVVFPDGTNPSFPGKFTVSPLGGWDAIQNWHSNNGVVPGAYSTIVGVHPEWGFPGSPGVLILRPVGGTSEANQVFTHLYQTNGAPQTEANRIPIIFNHWYDIVVHLVFGTTSATGRAEWWIDGVAQASVSVPTIVADTDGSVPGVGHWVGLYRGPSRSDTDTIYIDGVRVGPTRSSVGN